MSDEQFSRRRFLSGLAATGATGALAGCVNREPTEPLQPSFPREQMRSNGWTEFETLDKDGTVTTTVLGDEIDIDYMTKGVAFRNTELNDRIMQNYPEVAGLVGDAPLVTYGGAKTRTDPSIPRASQYAKNPKKRLLNRVESRLRQRLPEGDVTLKQTNEETGVTVDTGEEAIIRTYDITANYESQSVTIGDTTVMIEAGQVTFEAQVGLWFHNGLIATALGVYPDGDQSFKLTRSSETISNTIEVDTQMWRERVRALIKALD